MVAEDPVPIDSVWDDMVARAIRMALESVVGHTMVVEPASAMKDITGTMTAMRQAYKYYVLCHANTEFSLRLPLGNEGSGIEHQAQRVSYLLTGLNYLRDPRYPERELFSSDFFHNYMVHMLFLTPMELWKSVENNRLDTLFGLGGAAIAATLKDFSRGYYQEVDSSANRWRNVYVQILAQISTMRNDPARKTWLDGLQQNIVARGRAELPPNVNTF